MTGAQFEISIDGVPRGLIVTGRNRLVLRAIIICGRRLAYVPNQAASELLVAAFGVVTHTAIRQATQSVMKYIARKTIKLGYSPHSYSTNSPTR